MEVEVFSEIEQDYNTNNDYWAETYTNLLNNLAGSYMLTENLKKAKKLLDKLELIQYKLFLKNKTRWIKDYIAVLSTIANYYIYSNNKKNSKTYIDKAYKVIEKELFEDIDRWNHFFLICFRDTYLFYHLNNRTQDFMTRLKKILEFYSNENNEKYGCEYLEILVIYLRTLIQNNNLNDSRDLINKYSNFIIQYQYKTCQNISRFLIEWNELVDTFNKKQSFNMVKSSRNDPCPCNSGKKYKKCCGKNL